MVVATVREETENTKKLPQALRVVKHPVNWKTRGQSEFCRRMGV